MLMLIRQVNQESVIFTTIDIFWVKGLSFNQMSAMDVRMH